MSIKTIISKLFLIDFNDLNIKFNKFDFRSYEFNRNKIIEQFTNLYAKWYN